MAICALEEIKQEKGSRESHSEGMDDLCGVVGGSSLKGYLTRDLNSVKKSFVEIYGKSILGKYKGTKVRLSFACLRSRRVNSITGGRLAKGKVEEDEIREAQGTEGDR